MFIYSWIRNIVFVWSGVGKGGGGSRKRKEFKFSKVRDCLFMLLTLGLHCCECNHCLLSTVLVLVMCSLEKLWNSEFQQWPSFPKESKGTENREMVYVTKLTAHSDWSSRGSSFLIFIFIEMNDSRRSSALIFWNHCPYFLIYVSLQYKWGWIWWVSLYIYMKADRGDVPKGSAEIFFRKVKFWKEDGGEEAPPVFVGILFFCNRWNFRIFCWKEL